MCRLLEDKRVGNEWVEVFTEIVLQIQEMLFGDASPDTAPKHVEENDILIK